MDLKDFINKEPVWLRYLYGIGLILIVVSLSLKYLFEQSFPYFEMAAWLLFSLFFFRLVYRQIKEGL